MFIISIVFASCSEVPEKVSSQNENASEPLVKVKYDEFSPDSLSVPVIEGIDFDKAYKMGTDKIVVGYYTAKQNGYFSDFDTENDWGYRLFLLDEKDRIKYVSQGVGDTYLFEPHFYRNAENDQIVIVYQQAFEYFFGGEVFLFESGKPQHIGTLNIEAFNRNDMDECLTDILLISEESDRLSFTFGSDSLVLDPGGVNFEIIANNDVEYIYENEVFKLKQ